MDKKKPGGDAARLAPIRSVVIKGGKKPPRYQLQPDDQLFEQDQDDPEPQLP